MTHSFELPADSIFRNPLTRVKINPETYIKFDGSEFIVLQNVFAEGAIKIKYDIMLVLYDLVDWTTIGSILVHWPPDDQEKIMYYLSGLHSRKVVITDESETQQLPESGLLGSVGSHIVINAENHHAMLRDYVRVATYRRAIERWVTPETIALDLGCGTGVLGFFAAKAGAQKVYGLEKRPDILDLARAMAEQNGLSEQMQFIEGASSTVSEATITPKANLFISEILGNGVLDENILEFTLDAKTRFLTPDARMIPFKLDMFLFGFDNGLKPNRRQEIAEFTDLYGLDFTPLADVLCSRATLTRERYSVNLNKQMSTPILVKTFDFRVMEGAIFAQDFELLPLEDGTITGFCGYFKAWLDEDTPLTNSPWAPHTHWSHLIFTLQNGLSVQKNQPLKLTLLYDGSLRLQYQGQFL